MSVESQEGKGTCFSLDLPLWTGEAEENAPQTVPQNDQSARILIVDDDDIVLHFLPGFLNPKHSVSVTKRVEEAIELSNAQTFDIALLDLGMPGMSGDQLAYKLREINPNLVTILITGWELADRDPRLEPFDFKYQKPLRDLQGFQNLLSRAIEKSKAPKT